jgi:hypothetical protein
MDFWGYFIGLIAILVGAYVAQKIGSHTDGKVDELTAFTKEISGATQRLEDASRKVIDDINGLFNNLIDMLKMCEDEDVSITEFCLMNGPITFGKIHSYNKRFLQEILKKNSTEPDYFEFDNKVEKVQALVNQCFHKAQRCNALVYDKNTITFFFDKYYDTESDESDPGFIDYSIKGETLTLNEIDKDTTKVNVKDKFLSFNNATVKFLTALYPDAIRFSSKSSELQLYLMKGHREETKFWRSMLIFYFDEAEDNKTNRKRRKMVGIYSNNMHMYGAIKTIFDKEYDESSVGNVYE